MADGDPVGEIEVVEQDAGHFSVRIVGKEASIGLVFHEVEDVVGLTEFVGGIGKVDRAILGDVDIVGESERLAFGFGGEHEQVAGGVDP